MKKSSPTKNGKLWVIFLTIFIDLIGFSIIFPLFPSMLEYYLPKEGADSIFGHLISIIEGLSRKSGADTKFLTTVITSLPGHWPAILEATLAKGKRLNQRHAPGSA